MQILTDPRFYRDQIVGAGELPFPSGAATVAWIDARDIAAVAAQALFENGHAGRTYRITGPEALSLPRTAELHRVGIPRRGRPRPRLRPQDDRRVRTHPALSILQAALTGRPAQGCQWYPGSTGVREVSTAVPRSWRCPNLAW